MAWLKQGKAGLVTGLICDLARYLLGPSEINRLFCRTQQGQSLIFMVLGLCDLAELLFLCHSSRVYKVGPMEVTFKDYVLTSSVALLLCCVLEAFVTNILYCIYLGN